MSATEFLVTTLLFVVIGLVWYIVALLLRLRQSEQAREQAEQARATSSRWSAELEQEHRAQLTGLQQKQAQAVRQLQHEHAMQLEALQKIVRVSEQERELEMLRAQKAQEREQHAQARANRYESLMASWSIGDDETAKVISRTMTQLPA